MFFVYSDNKEPFTPRRGGSVWDMNPMKPYLEHYANLLYLQFIEKNTDVYAEKIQCRKEIALAEQKIGFWRRHPKFDSGVAATEVQKLKSDWKEGRGKRAG